MSCHQPFISPSFHNGVWFTIFDLLVGEFVPYYVSFSLEVCAIQYCSCIFRAFMLHTVFISASIHIIYLPCHAFPSSTAVYQHIMNMLLMPARLIKLLHRITRYNMSLSFLITSRAGLSLYYSNFIFSSYSTCLRYPVESWTCFNLLLKFILLTSDLSLTQTLFTILLLLTLIRFMSLLTLNLIWNSHLKFLMPFLLVLPS
jgi:hypothetical protein